MVAPRPLYFGLAVLLLGSTFARPYNSNSPSLYRRMEKNPNKIHDPRNSARQATIDAMLKHAKLFRIGATNPTHDELIHAGALQTLIKKLHSLNSNMFEDSQDTERFANIVGGNFEAFHPSSNEYSKAKVWAQQMDKSRNASPFPTL